MQNIAIESDKAIADYFALADSNDNNQMAVFGQIIAEILHNGMPVTNKAIISALISRLEQENDLAQLDVYRQLLELVVHKTPDDMAI